MQMTRTRHVALQTRRGAGGLWHELAQFDAGDEAAETAVRAACEQLARVDEKARFRIVTREALPLTLLLYSAAAGWRVA